MLLILGDGVARILGARGVNNLWVGYVSNPAVGIATLLALAGWQGTLRARRALHLLVPVFAAGWVVTVAAAEDLHGFSVLAFPLQSLLLLGLSLFTLVGKSLTLGSHGTLEQDWFWICSGLALSNGAASAAEPLSAMLLKHAPERLVQLFNFKAGIDLASALAITVGMLCPVPTAPSGPSSSPAR